MIKVFLGVLMSLTVLSIVSGCKNKNNKSKKIEMVAVGSLAPDFSLLDETGVARKLSDYRGQRVVLYFYPKDFTPGCTKQACSLRDGFAIYRENQIAILGVSYDSVKSHQEFKHKHRIPFTLLSDSEHIVAKKYGVDKGLMGYFVPSRTTFLINEQGVIVQILDKVDVAGHADQILRDFNIKV